MMRDQNRQPALEGLDIFNYDTLTDAPLGPLPLLSGANANITCTACYLQAQSMELYMSVVYDAAHDGFAEVAAQVDVMFNASLGVSMSYPTGTSSTGLSQFAPLMTEKILAHFQVFALGIALRPMVTADLSQQTSMGWSTSMPMKVTSGAALLNPSQDHILRQTRLTLLGCHLTSGSSQPQQPVHSPTALTMSAWSMADVLFPGKIAYLY